MITRRDVLTAALSGLLTRSLDAYAPFDASSVDPAVFRLAFGSCVSQRKPQEVWSRIEAHRPDLFLMMGDGVYPEHEGADRPVLEQLQRAYAQAASRAELRAFREHVPVIAIWDDNDYGGSDVGASFGYKRQSRDMFLSFWATPEEGRIRLGQSGIYGAWEFGSAGRRIQVIVPDLRYCRSEWAHTEENYREALGASGFGPYAASAEAGVTMLGEEQWAWLEACLRRPARLRVLVSSIQCIPEGRGWESWSNFPAEKARLLQLVRDCGAEGLVIVSGDTHYAELSVLEDSVVGYPLWEATSSGLTESWPKPGPNRHRIGPACPETNYGLLHVNWVSAPPVIVFEIYSSAGTLLLQQSVSLEALAREIVGCRAYVEPMAHL